MRWLIILPILLLCISCSYALAEQATCIPPSTGDPVIYINYTVNVSDKGPCDISKYGSGVLTISNPGDYTLSDVEITYKGERKYTRIDGKPLFPIHYNEVLPHSNVSIKFLYQPLRNDTCQTFNDCICARAVSSAAISILKSPSGDGFELSVGFNNTGGYRYILEEVKLREGIAFNDSDREVARWLPGKVIGPGQSWISDRVFDYPGGMGEYNTVNKFTVIFRIVKCICPCTPKPPKNDATVSPHPSVNDDTAEDTYDDTSEEMYDDGTIQDNLIDDIPPAIEETPQDNDTFATASPVPTAVEAAPENVKENSVLSTGIIFAVIAILVTALCLFLRIKEKL